MFVNSFQNAYHLQIWVTLCSSVPACLPMVEAQIEKKKRQISKIRIWSQENKAGKMHPVGFAAAWNKNMSQTQRHRDVPGGISRGSRIWHLNRQLMLSFLVWAVSLESSLSFKNKRQNIKKVIQSSPKVTYIHKHQGYTLYLFVFLTRVPSVPLLFHTTWRHAKVRNTWIFKIIALPGTSWLHYLSYYVVGWCCLFWQEAI